MTRAAALPALLLTAALLTSCGDAAEPTAAAPTPTSESPDPTPPKKAAPQDKGPGAVPDTLDFTATTVGGEELDGATLAGKPVLLWFWAPWCPTCRGQVPQVEGLAADYDGELAVVGVGSLDSAEAIADFAGDFEGVTHVFDTDGVLCNMFGVAEQSSFVLLAAEGEVAF